MTVLYPSLLVMQGKTLSDGNGWLDRAEQEPEAEYEKFSCVRSGCHDHGRKKSWRSHVKISTCRRCDIVIHCS